MFPPLSLQGSSSEASTTSSVKAAFITQAVPKPHACPSLLLIAMNQTWTVGNQAQTAPTRW